MLPQVTLLFQSNDQMMSREYMPKHQDLNRLKLQTCNITSTNAHAHMVRTAVLHRNSLSLPLLRPSPPLFFMLHSFDTTSNVLLAWLYCELTRSCDRDGDLVLILCIWCSCPCWLAILCMCSLWSLCGF